MELFLEKLARDLHGKYGDKISDICVVFPSRRAGIFFKQHLAKCLHNAIWSPQVYAIQDFIANLSPLPVADKLTLIFELYEVYRKEGEEDSFDKFYPWGDMLLNDFDDIDKNLVESDRLFRILREHKEVEEDFELKISDIEEFYKFWQTFSKKELTAPQESFIKTWEIMGRVYSKFRQKLEAANICYEGMAYRHIYELVQQKKLSIGSDKVVFAGFNLLNKAEKGIISGLIKQGIAETYWDTDNYYLDNKIQEAGNSLRENFSQLKIENVKWRGTDLSKSGKSIKIIGTPLEISQVKVLGNELKNIDSDSIEKTAVVLPDENLMIPVLHSLPENIETLNITMGYPFKNSALQSFIWLLKKLQEGNKGSGASSVYYHKDVIQILLHPYIKISAPEEINELIIRIRKGNIIYISYKRISEMFEKTPEILLSVFKDASTSEASLEYLFKIISLISQQLGQSDSNTAFEREFLYKFYTELNHLSNLLKKYTNEIGKDTFWMLLVEIIERIRIPFTGEPLKGLQVMGLLETRLLDFKNVFILSMNEGVMPRGNTNSSYIPHNLRKAFKMPTFEDEDSTSAYYFYRLIQRAKNICLIYNTEPGVFTAGEKSRYIMQVESELAEENKNIKLEHLIMQTDASLPKRKEISIPKSNEVIEALKKVEHFSATGLASYINCPLQFYFKTAAKLKEEESVEEYFSGGGFGTILHQIMEMLYKGYVGKSVDALMISTVKDRLKNEYDKLWEEACAAIPEYLEFRKDLTGKNLLYKNIVRKLIEKILDNDISESPFKLISLEEEITKDIEITTRGVDHKVKLLGRLDRVELKEGIQRIIDYKTGAIDKTKLSKKITDENIGLLFNVPDFKEMFQQYFYINIYLSGKTGTKIKAGIYPLRGLSDGILFFDKECISEGTIKLFDSMLKEMLTKIFDDSTVFTQTEDVKRCQYCPYKSICYRD